MCSDAQEVKSALVQKGDYQGDDNKIDRLLVHIEESCVEKSEEPTVNEVLPVADKERINFGGNEVYCDDHGRRRNEEQNAASSCPICGKVFNRAVSKSVSHELGNQIVFPCPLRYRLYFSVLPLFHSVYQSLK